MSMTKCAKHAVFFIKKALRRRLVVTLPAGEGAFSGILVDCDNTYWIFEDARSVPRRANVKPSKKSPISD